MSTALDIVTNALFELGVQGAGEAVSAADSAFALSKLNRLIDSFNTRRLFIFNVGFDSYNIIPNHQPHTIGQGVTITATVLAGNVATYTAKNSYQVGQSVTVAGTSNGGGIFNVTGVISAATATSFSLNIVHGNVGSAADSGSAVLSSNALPDFITSGARPVKIIHANIVLNNVTPVVRHPLNLRDDDWWANQRVQTVATSLPSDLYYSPAFPNGQLFLWPVPTVAYQLELETWSVLNSFPSLATTFAFPPGYEDAITYALAISLAPAFEAPIHPALGLLARQALSNIQGLNVPSLMLELRDSGLSGRHGSRADFNYLTGSIV